MYAIYIFIVYHCYGETCILCFLNQCFHCSYMHFISSAKTPLISPAKILTRAMLCFHGIYLCFSQFLDHTFKLSKLACYCSLKCQIHHNVNCGFSLKFGISLFGVVFIMQRALKWTADLTQIMSSQTKMCIELSQV